MQTTTIAAVAAFGGALLALAAYHFTAVGPRFRRLAGIVSSHDDLLNSGRAEGASARLSSLEEAVSERKAQAERTELRLAELEKAAQHDVSRVGFLRFNAFPDAGAELSYALALLNDSGDGVVISSIFSREDTRTFGKAVNRFQPLQEASREELSAIALARNSSAAA